MPTLRLTYFNAPGRAEPIRLALRIGGLAFEDHRLDFPGFGAAKASGAPTGHDLGHELGRSYCQPSSSGWWSSNSRLQH